MSPLVARVSLLLFKATSFPCAKGLCQKHPLLQGVTFVTKVWLTSPLSQGATFVTKVWLTSPLSQGVCLAHTYHKGLPLSQRFGSHHPCHKGFVWLTSHLSQGSPLSQRFGSHHPCHKVLFGSHHPYHKGHLCHKGLAHITLVTRVCLAHITLITRGYLSHKGLAHPLSQGVAPRDCCALFARTTPSQKPTLLTRVGCFGSHGAGPGTPSYKGYPLLQGSPLSQGLHASFPVHSIPGEEQMQHALVLGEDFGCESCAFGAKTAGVAQAAHLPHKSSPFQQALNLGFWRLLSRHMCHIMWCFATMWNKYLSFSAAHSPSSLYSCTKSLCSFIVLFHSLLDRNMPHPSHKSTKSLTDCKQDSMLLCICLPFPSIFLRTAREGLHQVFALSTLAVKHGMGCMGLLWVAEHAQGQVGQPALNLVFCVLFLDLSEKNTQPLCWCNLLVATWLVKPACVVQQGPHDM